MSRTRWKTSTSVDTDHTDKYYQEDPADGKSTRSKFVRLRNQSKYLSKKTQEDASVQPVHQSDSIEFDEIDKKWANLIDQEDLKFFKLPTCPRDKPQAISYDNGQKDKQQQKQHSYQAPEEQDKSKHRRNQREDSLSTQKGNHCLKNDSQDIFGPSLIVVSNYEMDEENDKNFDSIMRDSGRFTREENNLLKKFDRECGPSTEKILREIEMEKMEVAKMLENMMLSNTSVKENHNQVEEIFKKYSLSESEQKTGPQETVTKATSKPKLEYIVFQNTDETPHRPATKDRSNCSSSATQQQPQTSVPMHVGQDHFHSFQNKENMSPADISNLRLSCIERIYETGEFGKQQSTQDESMVLRDLNNIMGPKYSNQSSDEKNHCLDPNEYIPCHPTNLGRLDKSYESPNDDLCHKLVSNFKKSGKSEKEAEHFKRKLDALLSLSNE